MQKTITAREANQRFARVLREAEEGSEFVITRHGRPVARIAPIAPRGKRVLTPHQQRVLDRMIKRMRRGWNLGGEKFDRESLYDERIERVGRKK
ncbi:MAG: type II toxin-antitoxin system prevent-host-death family antitoxin [Alphaproteobacteria bacterium]|nr:type II toxin-antitoxin system prevent-host-death family antitoxin [Alphaproteobacteria bacterium]